MCLFEGSYQELLKMDASSLTSTYLKGEQTCRVDPDTGRKAHPKRMMRVPRGAGEQSEAHRCRYSARHDGGGYRGFRVR